MDHGFKAPKCGLQQDVYRGHEVYSRMGWFDCYDGNTLVAQGRSLPEARALIDRRLRAD